MGAELTAGTSTSHRIMGGAGGGAEPLLFTEASALTQLKLSRTKSEDE